MEQSLKDKFITKLEEKYGAWNKSTSKFGATSFGVISQDLSISASQFTKLIYGTATEGMYQRSIENINRLLQRESIRIELAATLEEKEELERALLKRQQQMAANRKKRIPYVLVSLLTGALLAYLVLPQLGGDEEVMVAGDHPLSIYFDQDFNASFNSPYLDIAEVQDFCPCSAYEGEWGLSNQYKLPLPGSRRPGLYYLAKSADVRMKCSRYDTTALGQGYVLSAYEYLINEIWLDTKMTPLSPTYFNQEILSFTQEFEELQFEGNPQFQKVATIHSFFTDKFEIYQDSIVRKGEPCGRYASDVNQELAAEYEIDIKYILKNVLGNMTTTRCSSTVNPFCDPNDLKEKESTILFDCIYTINNENLGIGGGYPYQKGYLLKKQNYADNLICACE
ncbi:MAG: hypothetical protein ACRBG0_02660 [Lewinella sp.]|uniref:hypothetical protein n=1 Tax=Lewinella sp. TaxID=2004506 RepID=UPI003D6A36FB